MADCGLIFDVDGVIADTEPMNARATIRAYAELLGCHDVVRADFTAGLGRGAEAYIRAAAEVHGIALSEAQVGELAQRRQDNFLAILKEEPLPAFPGVLPLMRSALSDSRFRAAIATSSARAMSEAVLRSAGIPYDRMAYVTGSDIQRKKPAPDLFLTAAGRMELDPVRCLVIEDAPDGVAAARAAGCRCLAVTNSTGASNLAGADLVVSSLEEVDLETVRRLISR